MLYQALKTYQNKSFCAEVYPLKLLLNSTVLDGFPWIWICRCVTQRETVWPKLPWWTSGSNTKAPHPHPHPRGITSESSSTILTCSLGDPNRRGQAFQRPPTENMARPLNRCESTSQGWRVSVFSQERNVGEKTLLLEGGVLISYTFDVLQVTGYRYRYRLLKTTAALHWSLPDHGWLIHKSL